MGPLVVVSPTFPFYLGSESITFSNHVIGANLLGAAMLGNRMQTQSQVCGPREKSQVDQQ